MENNGKDFSTFTVRFNKKAVTRSVLQTFLHGNSQQKRYCGKNLLWVETVWI